MLPFQTFVGLQDMQWHAYTLYLSDMALVPPSQGIGATLTWYWCRPHMALVPPSHGIGAALTWHW
jgi:hypothetical protein